MPPSPEILKILRDLIATSQTALSDYTFRANEKHNKIKQMLLEINKSDNKLEDCLKQSIDDLEDYLYTRLSDMFNTCYQCIFNIFQSRSSLLLSTSVKVLVGNQLITLLQEPENFVVGETVEANENSAFKQIAQGSKYFCCNNIPVAFQQRIYEDSRLIKEKVFQYIETGTSTLDRRLEEYDTAWIECWKDVTFLDSNEKDPRSSQACYKSVLVIPLSLGKQLDSNFQQHFHISDNINQVIFGFLLFEHPHVNFFDVDTDIDFAYILADILSLFIIQKLSLTHFSSTYQNATSLSHMTFNVDSERNHDDALSKLFPLTAFVKYSSRWVSYVSRAKAVHQKEEQEEFLYIEKQSRLFDEAKQELLREYKGKYILFEDNCILDFGDERASIAMRAYKRDGIRPLFIEKV